MKTPEQLKGAIRNIAKEKDLHAQEVLQIFMFERILERLSLSPYKKNFVLKGGLLISSMIGISSENEVSVTGTVIDCFISATAFSTAEVTASFASSFILSTV